MPLVKTEAILLKGNNFLPSLVLSPTTIEAEGSPTTNKSTFPQKSRPGSPGLTLRKIN
jgi:hypothetical protein